MIKDKRGTSGVKVNTIKSFRSKIITGILLLVNNKRKWRDRMKLSNIPPGNPCQKVPILISETWCYVDTMTCCENVTKNNFFTIMHTLFKLILSKLAWVMEESYIKNCFKLYFVLNYTRYYGSYLSYINYTSYFAGTLWENCEQEN